ncbi:MAG: hypothetical protein JSV33_09465 [bacterium]|nr:MAG: hypothetical protein JSV33_09465 [bacterium]
MKTGCIALTCMAAILISVPTAIRAQTITMEAESYIDYNDIGGTLIQSVPGDGCSGGYMLIGLDVTDEWTEYSNPVPDAGIYRVVAKCRGDAGTPYNLQMTFTPQPFGGLPETITFSFTGYGYD